MIEYVVVRNKDTNTTVVLNLRRPELSGFEVRSITGLGPVKGTVNMLNMASNPGGVYQSTKIGTRNIVLYLNYLWNPTIEDTRRHAAQLFMPGANVELDFKTDQRYFVTAGIVEANEVEVFSSGEGSQVSIICPDPYFLGTNLTNGTVLNPPSRPNMEIQYSSITTATYSLSMPGTVPVGFEMTIVPKTSSSTRMAVSIGNSTISFAAPFTYRNGVNILKSSFEINDNYHLDTRQGHKAFDLVIGGVAYSALGAHTPDSVWPMLLPGTNAFSIRRNGSLYSNYFTVSVKFTPKFEAI